MNGPSDHSTVKTPHLRSRAAPVIECAPLPMVEVEGPEHRVCFANSAFCRLLQRTRADLLGKPFDRLVRNGDRCRPILDRVYETGEGKTHVEADDSESAPAYWVYAMWPALADSGTPERVVIQLTRTTSFREDLKTMNAELLVAGLRQHELREQAEQANASSRSEIAERLLAEAALREANARLTQATAAAEHANAAKDEFLAALSHELRTPLTPALIAAASLREDARLPSAARTQAEMIERNINLEARLIDDLLDFTRITHGKLLLRREISNAHSLVNLAIDMLRDEVRDKQIVIERIFDAQPSIILVDPARFQQVVWNLLRNAIKFSPSGSRIIVRTSAPASAAGDPWFRLEVTDPGIGIHPAKLERIFRPFDQGDRAGDHRFGGVGLGLAIARAIITAHGGTITAASAGRNCGATFVADLPRAVDQEQERAHKDLASVTATATSSPASRQVPPLRILLVEDHASTLQAVKQLLQRDGHRVIAATTAGEAMTAAANEPLDVVISDLGLPDRPGTELMMDLRAAFGLRGVALTGYGMEEDLMRTRGAGFLHHLVKPVSIEDLRRVIASFPSSSEAPARSEPERPSAPSSVHLEKAEVELAEGVPLLVEHAPLPLVEVEGAGHVVSFVNTAFCQLLGKTRSELLGRPFVDLVPGSRPCLPSLDRLRQSLVDAPAPEADAEAPPAVWLRARWRGTDASEPAGSFIIQLTRTAGFRQNATAINSALLVAGLHQHELTADAVALNAQLQKEIADRKQTESALHEASQRLAAQASELEQLVDARTKKLRETVEELEGFSYSVAHDMRAPLRWMQGFSRILLDDYGEQLPPKARGYLEKIASSAARMDVLIVDVLNYTRVLGGEVRLGPVALDALVRDIITTYPNWQPPHAVIEVKGELPVVIGHVGFLTQCISNLLSNAVKFVASGVLPHVTIWAEDRLPSQRDPSPAEPRPGAGLPLDRDATVRIYLEDNGLGIRDSDRERIFGMFVRTQSTGQFEGTGIGLTIVRKAVQRMGGRIDFVSEPGKGTTFWIELQKAPELLPQEAGSA